jgi:hypothetical protein
VSQFLAELQWHVLVQEAAVPPYHISALKSTEREKAWAATYEWCVRLAETG